MLRAELEGSGSVMVDAFGERPVRLDPGPYGESLGGCIAWHLAETTSRFRCFEPDELARTCDAVVVAQGANELLGHAGLTCTLDAGVGFECGNPDIRMELERHGLAAGELSQLGTLVSGQVLRTTGHPDDPCRPRNNVGVPAVEPVGFRPLDSRWPEAVEPITDRVLSVCVRSGVALTLTDGDRVRVWQDGASGAREEPWPALRAYSSYARVEHPIPERFETPEAWARSVLEATALAVATHPRLANQVQLDDLTRTYSGVEKAAPARDGGGAVRQRHGQPVRAVRCASRAGVGLGRRRVRARVGRRFLVPGAAPARARARAGPAGGGRAPAHVVRGRAAGTGGIGGLRPLAGAGQGRLGGRRSRLRGGGAVVAGVHAGCRRSGLGSGGWTGAFRAVVGAQPLG